MLNKIATAAQKGPANKYIRLTVEVATVLAMLAYSAFPLAIFLNKAYFWHGLVSTLTEPGQPHYMFFTSIDIISSLFGIILFGYLSWRERWDKVQSVVLILVVVACVGEVLTDLFSLPTGYSTIGDIPTVHYATTHPALIIHLVASFVNSAAFVVSFGLWVMHRRRTETRSVVREVVFAITLSVGLVGTVIGYIFPVTSPTLQRVFILCYCYWFITLPYDSFALKPN